VAISRGGGGPKLLSLPPLGIQGRLCPAAWTLGQR